MALLDLAKEIKPILESMCVQWRGPDRQKGNLRLDSSEAWLKGGASGPVFTAEHPEKIDFSQGITLAENEDGVRRPKNQGDYLTPAQIGRIKRSILEPTISVRRIGSYC